MALIRSIATLQETLDTQIAQGDLDSALHLIHRTVDQVFCEPINTAQIFGSKLLDEYCQKAGAINWRRIQNSAQPAHRNNESGNTVVYVASRLYDFGGHTPVVADIIRLGPSARSIILITGTVGATNLAAIRHRFEGLTQVSLECAPHGTFLEKLNWLQRKLLEFSPSTVWLFNHNQDSVAVAAVQPDAGYRLRYYHHGDHQLCLGVYLDYADHIDPHPMGFHNCRDHLGIQNNRYLPLTVKDHGAPPAKEARTSDAMLITCTAASRGKIEAPYFINYADVIPEMLHASGGKHIHIGPLSSMTLWRIRRAMRKLGVPDNGFVHIPYVRSVWDALHEYRVNLYITSFPYSGGRTLIEAMGAGVAVALHLHCRSRLLSSFDMAFEGAMLWRSPSELYKYVQQTDAETLRQQGKAARKKYLECYREEALAGALINWEHPLPPPPLLKGYTPDKLQQALDITNQVSFIGALHRVLCRAVRRWKSSQA
ncbi:MAG: hypothetical protein M0P59_06605 [Gallionella sp.]|jgi:hypothetical protein|nr:hypothetical protein [Gallionella sp.]